MSAALLLVNGSSAATPLFPSLTLEGTRRLQQALSAGAPLGPVRCGLWRREVALTFDDGPNRDSPLFVATLRQLKLAATFFVVGQQARAYPQGLQAEMEYGALGEHSWSHTDLRLLSDAAILDEIRRSDRLLPPEARQLLRPPYGARNDRVDRVLAGAGRWQINWSVDPRDWDSPGRERLLWVLRSQLRPGSIVVLHERTATRQALPAIARLLADLRLRTVTVPELLAHGVGTCRQPRPAGAG